MIADAVTTAQAVIIGATLAVGFLAGLAALAVVAVGALVFNAVARWWKRRHVTEHDVGPDALRLLQDLDAHLDAFVLSDPDVANGFARLRNTTQPQEGDSRDA